MPVSTSGQQKERAWLPRNASPRWRSESPHWKAGPARPRARRARGPCLRFARRASSVPLLFPATTPPHVSWRRWATPRPGRAASPAPASEAPARPRGLPRRQRPRLAGRRRGARRARVPAHDRGLPRLDRRGRAHGDGRGALARPARHRHLAARAARQVRSRAGRGRGRDRRELRHAVRRRAGLPPRPARRRAARSARDRRPRDGALDPLARAGDGLARAARRDLGAERARLGRRYRGGLPADRVRREHHRARGAALDAAGGLRVLQRDARMGGLARRRRRAARARAVRAARGRARVRLRGPAPRPAPRDDRSRGARCARRGSPSACS